MQTEIECHNTHIRYKLLFNVLVVYRGNTDGYPVILSMAKFIIILYRARTEMNICQKHFILYIFYKHVCVGVFISVYMYLYFVWSGAFADSCQRLLTK